MLKFNCAIITGCERRPWCHFIAFENSVEPLVPHILTVGNYSKSPLTKLIDAGWPRWKAFATCLVQSLAVKSGSIQPAEPNQPGSHCGKVPQLAVDGQHKHQLYKYGGGQHVKTTLLQSKLQGIHCDLAAESCLSLSIRIDENPLTAPLAARLSCPLSVYTNKRNVFTDMLI